MIELTGAMLQPTCGIYEIKNAETGQCYIGKSNQMPARWAKHFTDLGNGKHSLILLQRDWNKYGPAAFTASVVKLVEDESVIFKEEDAVALQYLENGVKLYNAAIAGWVNEEERAARLARKRAASAKKKRVLQRKRESQDETRDQRRGDSGNAATLRKDGYIQGRGGVPGDSPGASMEGAKRGLRKSQASVLAGKQGDNRETGTEGSPAKSMDADERRWQSYQDYKASLSIVDSEAAGIFFRLVEEGLRPERTLREVEFHVTQDAAMLAYGMLTLCNEETVQMVRDILDPLTLVFLFRDDAAFDRARRFVDAGGDRTQTLMRMMDEDGG